ncbi:hypothetical protein [Mycobacterium sp. AZCC_0083]|uniref:hypothetical protein n=1 Tax=Mycobacterium sp. AZCC_0083 TaxID=2735882 RepID=UPI001613BB9F|nr:hypothetical protein [Mycobacterium sp. AZCC_0083]MBB5162578.1 hypothetical protein [Mycobacterium sp. AZCC_0083]
MNSERATGKKLLEWVRRYLPCEIAGTTCELGGAAIAYLFTGSYAAAAVAATIGASVGYYAAAYTCAVRTTYRELGHLQRTRRVLAANAIALRSVAIEFGPAEVIDSLFIRPAAFYLGPVLFGNMLGGWIFAKLVADVGFYALAILSYERFKGLLAVGRPTTEAADYESVATLAVS